MDTPSAQHTTQNEGAARASRQSSTEFEVAPEPPPSDVLSDFITQPLPPAESDQENSTGVFNVISAPPSAPESAEEEGEERSYESRPAALIIARSIEVPIEVSLELTSTDLARRQNVDTSRKLTDVQPNAERHLSTDKLLIISQSSLIDIAHSGGGGSDGGGGSGSSAGSIIADKIEAGLQRDSNNKTVFDRKIDSLEQDRQRLLTQVEKPGASPLLVSHVLSLSIQQDLLLREKKKHEDVMRLALSLNIGVVPSALIRTLIDRGLGDVVRRVVLDTVGSGRLLSRSAVRDLAALSAYGLGDTVVPEHHSEEGVRAELRERQIDTLKQRKSLLASALLRIK